MPDKAMEIDISKPQRQSIAGILILFFDSFYQLAKQFWPFLILAVVKINAENLPLILGGAGALTIIVGISAWLVYYHFTFYFDSDKNEFVVNRGVFKKSRIAIHVDKIQQVNINQSVIQSLMNVYSLEIDTAGSSFKEVRIRAINYKIALHLKENILEFRSLSGIDTESASDFEMDDENNDYSEDFNAADDGKRHKTPFHQLSPMMLFKIGITTKYGRTLVLIIGFFATLYGNMYEAISTFELNEEEIEGTLAGLFAMLSIGILFGILIMLVLIFNITASFVRHYDFRMFLRKYSLFISSGLLVKKNTLIRPQKMQITSISQNFFQRKLKFLDLKIWQASPADGNAQNMNTTVEVPGCDVNDREKLLKVLFRKDVNFDREISPNYRYLIKAFVLSIVIPVAAYGFFAHFSLGDVLAHWYFVAGYIAAALLLIYFQFRNSRLKISEDFIAVQSGAWDVKLKIIEPYKLQGITLKQLFWHRRSNVGHIVFHTAAGDLTFRYAPFSTVKKAADYWLYRVESSKKAWM